MPLELFEAGPKGLRDFIRLPYSVYPKDSPYVPRLEGELKKELSPRHNPFFRHAEAKYFLATRGGRPAGRVASVVNRLHNDFHGERTGFFGFFECREDPEAAAALLGAAAEELRRKGMEVMRGPMSFSTNEECGLLVEGFEHPPTLMTPYNPPYYASLIEGFGLRRAKDLYAFAYDVGESLPEKMLRAAAIAQRREGVKVRPIRKDRFSEEMRAFREVYNSAWARNWGFVPLTEGEVLFKGKLLKSIAVPEMTLIAEKDGEPVGFLGLVPDVNRVLKRMRGKMNPLTLVKALYRFRRVRDLRLLLLGIKPGFRTRGVDALLYRDAFSAAKRLGYERMEFSWVLEDNEAMLRIIELMKARLYRKFRVYEMPLTRGLAQHQHGVDPAEAEGV
ncbi:MAG: GNAT family N-acetyltransferase [Nitrospirota bacterium]